MRAIVVGAVVVLAGCSEPPGISLEIAADDASIATVEVYVGEHCDNCPGGMRPPQLSPKAADLYLVTDPTPWVATVEGGVAGIRIESDVDIDVPVLVLVGFDEGHMPKATRTLHDLHISASAAEVWHTTLSPASPLVDTNTASPPPPAGTERIAIWKSPNQTLPACVMVEHWDGDRAYRDALVPDEDRDCDAVPPDLECAMYTPNATGIAASIDEANCLLQVVDKHATCLIGGPPCTETNAPAAQCDYLDEDYCTPLDLCSCAPADGACLEGVIQAGVDATSGVMSHLRCRLPAQQDGTNCPDARPVVVTLDAGAFLQGSSTKCKKIRFHDANAIGGDFRDSVTLDTPDFHGTLSVTSFDEPCKAELEWKGTITADGQRKPFVFADLDLDNGKHLVVPFVFELLPCGSAAKCEAIRAPDATTQETMFFCTEPAPSSESCEPSAPCAGPICGSTCCGAGEACVDGACRCGVLARCANDLLCTGGVASDTGCGTHCR